MPVLNEASRVYLGSTLIYQKQPKANAVYYKGNGQGSWVQASVSWSTDHYVSEPATAPGFIVMLTTDGNAPANDLSNVINSFHWTTGGGFGIIASVPFTDDGTHGESYIQVSL